MCSSRDTVAIHKPFNSAAIFESKSGSILLIKAFFFDTDLITFVRIAKKKKRKIGLENVFVKEKQVIKNIFNQILFL